MQKNCPVYIQCKGDIVIVDIKQHKSQFKHSNITITQCQKNFADCVMETTHSLVRCIKFINLQEVTTFIYWWVDFLAPTADLLGQFFFAAGWCQDKEFTMDMRKLLKHQKITEWTL